MRTDEVILGRTLREHIGGRWAVSLPAIGIYLPISLVSIGANVEDSRSLSSVDNTSSWLLVALVGFLVFCAVLVLSNFTLLRRRRVEPVPVWLVVLVGGIAGGLRGMVVAWLAFDWGLSDQYLVGLRLTVGTLLGGVLVPLLALILSTLESYRTRRGELLTELAGVEVERLRQHGVTLQMRRTALAEMESQVREVIASGDPEAARNIGRRIWQEAASDLDARVTVASVVRAAILTNPYPTGLVIGVWVLGAWGTMWLAVGFPRMLPQLCFSVACFVLVFALARWVTARTPRLSAFILLLTIVTLTIATGPVASWLFDPRPFSATTSVMVVHIIWIPLVIVSAGLAVSAIRSGEDVLSRLAREVDDEEVRAVATRREQGRIRRELARELHGTVQSRLLAASASTGPLVDYDLIFQGIHGTRESLSLEARVQRTLDPWSELMTITCGPLPAEIPPYLASVIEQVLEEGLSNAFRHGAATEVEVAVQADDGVITIRVSDNGTGPSEHPEPGLGGHILSASGTWTLTPGSERGTILEVLVPLKS